MARPLRSTFPFVLLLSSAVWAHLGASAAEVPMRPLQGKWAEKDGVWKTEGKRPSAGWYLRSIHQYGIGKFSFDLKKTAADELVFVYLRDWQIVLRQDSVTARYAGFIDGEGKRPSRYWDQYWFTATRPLEFNTTGWQSFEISLANGGILIRHGGEEALNFSSPAEEWEERVRNSGKFKAFAPYVYPASLPGSSGDRQVLVVHAYGGGLELAKLRVAGTEGKPAENFHQEGSNPEVLPADVDLPLVRPEGVIKVDWTLSSSEAKRIAALPAVADWKIASFANTRPDAASDVGRKPSDGKKGFPKVMACSVNVPELGTFPGALVLNSRYPSFPQEGRVDFHLSEAGVYTLKLGWGNWGLGWGPNIVEIKVDGKPVLLDVYRALMQYGACSPGMEAIPLELPAGPHSVSIALVTDRFGFHYLMKNLAFPISELALVRGKQEFWKEANVANPREQTQRAPAIDDPPSWGEWHGARLNYRLEGLQPGRAYDVRLTFFDVESTGSGQHMQDILINGKPVAANLDVFAEAGGSRLLEKAWTARAEDNGEIRLQLKGAGKRQRAFVNSIELRSANELVFRENFGWHPFIARQPQRILSDAPAQTGNPAPLEPPRWTSSQPFDGFNLAANPHFSMQDSERAGKPAFWYSVAEIAATANHPFAEYKLFPGQGQYAYDDAAGNQQAGAVRLGKTAPEFGLTGGLRLTDPHKRQKFSFFARGDVGAAPVKAKFLWFALNMDATTGRILPAPKMQLVGASEGEPVQPDGKWRKVEITARPPGEALFGVAVIVASGNAGSSIWIDDAEWNGYGAEPLEITRSFAGFHPSGGKEVLVKSFSGSPIRWKLVRSDGGKVAAEGNVQDAREEWFSKRHYFSVDFSSVREPGDYRLEVAQGAETASAGFRIAGDVYDKVAGMMLGALHNKRFNADVENAHDPDMLDYASVPKTLASKRHMSYEPPQSPERIDLLGGYYDAGDQIKHTEFWPAVILAAFNAREAATKNAALRSSAEAELRWILEAFHKFALEDGTIFTTAKPQGSGLDNIPLYSFDPLPCDVRNVTQVAGSCAMSSYELKDKDPALSARYLEIAEANYGNPGLWKIVAEAGDVDPRKISAAAKALWAEMYLAKLSKSTDYPQRMERSAGVLAEGLKKRAYADLAEMVHVSDQNGAALQDCVWVPARFIRMYPGHPMVPALKEGLRAFAGHVEQLSATTIWGQAAAMNGIQPGKGAGSFPAYGTSNIRNIGYWPMLAHSLAQAGMALEDEKVIRLAERQIQWCLGKNQVDLSVVQGVGDRFVGGGDLYWWRDQFFNHWLGSPEKMMFHPGYVMTAAFRDIGSGRPTSKAILTAGTTGVPQELYPLGYPIVPAQPPYGVRPGGLLPSEVYLPELAHFSLAASSVAAGMEWIGQHGKASIP